MKIKMLSLIAFLLTFTGCSVVEETIDAGKNISSAIVDESIELGQTAISIPVQVVGTVVDKLEEETIDEETQE